MLNTPVVFIIFNRPDVTARVFETIAAVKPRQLFVIADGPRGDFEIQKCKDTRAIIDQVDWDCDLRTNFSTKNLGCKKRISSGLSWVFEQVDEAIILEDDCLPSQSFFPFCEQLLEVYQQDERVMMISGNNYLPDSCKVDYSYYFSRDPQIWGWATWKRAWQKYDARLNLWQEAKSQGWIEDVYNSPLEYAFWQHRYDKAFSGKVDSWAHFWAFTCLAQNGLVIRPEKNLVSNIGFGPEATHTRRDNILSNYPKDEIDFPLRHPKAFLRNAQFDRCEFQRVMLKHKNPDGKKQIRSIFLRFITALYLSRLKIKKLMIGK